MFSYRGRDRFWSKGRVSDRHSRGIGRVRGKSKSRVSGKVMGKVCGRVRGRELGVIGRCRHSVRSSGKGRYA